MSQRTNISSNEQTPESSGYFNPKRNSFRLKSGKSFWLAWTVLIAGLFLTCATALYVGKGVEASARKEFEFACREITNRISTRLQQHAQILRSGSSLFEITGSVSREQWRNSIAHQNIEHVLPGVQGIGYSVIIRPDELARHEQKIRHEGFLQYSIRPAGKRELYTSIIYLEPFSGRNLRAFGYDMFSETVRRRAMEHARDSNAAALSGKITLVQETDKERQAGTLMYVPVYAKDLPTTTVKERRKAIRGWVYSPYRMNDLMRGILGGWEFGAGRKIRLEVFDDTLFHLESLLYDSKQNQRQDSNTAAIFSEQVSIGISGHLWGLRFTQVDGPSARIDYSKAWYVLIGGTAVGGLLFVLSILLINTRDRAYGMAETLTRELRESKDQISQLLQTTDQGIYGIDMEGCCTFINKSGLEILGYRLEDCVGRNMHDLIHHSHSNGSSYAVEECPIFRARLTGVGSRVESEVLWRRDGTSFSAEYSSYPFFENGKIYGAVVTFSDITGRKQREEEQRKSRNLLAISQQLARIGSWETELSTGKLLWSDEMYRLLGFPEPSPIYLDMALSVFPPDELVRFREAIASALRGDAPYNMDYTILRYDGQIRLIHDEGEVVRDDHGTAVRMFGTTQDITERKQAEEKIMQSLREKETLIRELYHRTKNTMQVIRGMLALQAAEFSANGEVQQLVRNTGERIQAISLVHQMLYSSRDLSRISIREYLQELSTSIIQGFGNSADRISLNITSDDQYFLLDTSIPLGLMMTELITNSLEHAFPDDRKGMITIVLTKGESDKTVLQYSDNGVGVPDGFDFRNQNTLGLELIYGLGEQQMMGTVIMKNINGVSCVFEFQTNLYEARV